MTDDIKYGFQMAGLCASICFGLVLLFGAIGFAVESCDRSQQKTCVGCLKACERLLNEEATLEVCIAGCDDECKVEK